MIGSRLMRRPEETADVSRLLEAAFGPLFGSGGEGWSTRAGAAWVPPTDTFETEDNYGITVDLPGVNPDDVNITFESGMLSIEGSREWRSKEGENARHMERVSGHFVRRFGLPKEVDAEKIAADFDQGVLTITVPKAASAKPRSINIGRGGSQKQMGSGRTDETREDKTK